MLEPSLDKLSDQELRQYVLMLADPRTSYRTLSGVSGPLKELFLSIPRTAWENKGEWLREQAAAISDQGRERLRATLNAILSEYSPEVDDNDTLRGLADFSCCLRLTRAAPTLLRLSKKLHAREAEELSDRLVSIVAGFSPDERVAESLKRLLLKGEIRPNVAGNVFCSICEANPNDFERCFPAFIAAYDQLPEHERGDEYMVSAILELLPAPIILPHIKKLAPDHRARMVRLLKTYAPDQFDVSENPDTITLRGKSAAHTQRIIERREQKNEERSQ